jgi:hypothetical protein
MLNYSLLIGGLVNTKRIIGIVVLIVGIIAVIYASHLKGRIASSESNVKTGTSLFGGNPVGSAVGGVMEGKISSYKGPVMMLMIGGIILVVVGAGMALFCRGRK